MPNNKLSLVDLSSLLEPLSSPVNKLLETIANGIGNLWEPTRIRKMAKAEADAARIKADAEIDIARMRVEGSLELQEFASRAVERINYREMRRQQNIESIIGKAVYQLPGSVSEEEVDQDWIAQFFNCSQDVSNEEMQVIWAQLLAGEVTQPGSYSLRTLWLVQTLRQSDAMLFRRVCNYLWKVGGVLPVHFYTPQTDDLLKRKNIHYSDFVHLQSLNLFSAPSGTVWPVRGDETASIEYFGKRYQLKGLDDDKREIPVRMLTDIGLELAPLCDTEPDEEYCDVLIETWRDSFRVKAQVF